MNGSRWMATVPAMLLGSVVVYVPGLIWLKHSVPFDWGWTIHYGLTVFIVGDLLKIAADAAILDPRAPWGKLFDRIRFPDDPSRRVRRDRLHQRHHAVPADPKRHRRCA